MSGWWEDPTIAARWLDTGRLKHDATELLALLIELRDEWFEPHYGTNDIGMAALLRDKIRTVITKAEDWS